MMNLKEMYEVVGERIKITMNKELTPEERQIENEQSAIIFEGIKQAVNVGDLILRVEKLQAQSKCLSDSQSMKLVRGE